MDNCALAAPCPSLLRQTIEQIDWRVDVLVAASHGVRRLAAPVVLLTLTLSPSNVRLSFRLTQADLHQWRMVLAKGVRDLAYLERKRPASHKRSKKS